MVFSFFCFYKSTTKIQFCFKYEVRDEKTSISAFFLRKKQHKGNEIRCLIRLSFQKQNINP